MIRYGQQTYFWRVLLSIEDFRTRCIMHSRYRGICYWEGIVRKSGAFRYLAIEFCYRSGVLRRFGRRRRRRARRRRHLVRVFDAAARPVVLGGIAGHPVTSGRPVVADGPSHLRFVRSTGHRVQPSCARRGDFGRRAGTMSLIWRGALERFHKILSLPKCRRGKRGNSCNVFTTCRSARTFVENKSCLNNSTERTVHPTVYRITQCSAFSAGDPVIKFSHS